MQQCIMFRVKKVAVTFFTVLTCLLCFNHTEIQAKENIFDDLLGVCFPNEKEGWACGRAGLVLHSENGGVDWLKQQTNTDYTLIATHFVDGENGWAVGDEGMIIKTINGGVSWQKQQSPASCYLMDVCAVTPLKAWICTEKGAILHTTDGGANWQIQFQNDRFKINSLSFFSETIGWAAGEHGFIYYTNDGGNSWLQKAGCYEFTEYDELLTGNLIFDIEAINEKTAWTVGIDGVVTKTEDAGGSWATVATGALSTQLFTISSNKNDILIICGEGEFMASRDGGTTWSQEILDPPIKYDWIYSADHIAAERFIAVGAKTTIYKNEKVGLNESWLKVSIN